MDPICVPLRKISGQQVGGKAKGLTELMHLGLNVPDGFVVTGASKGHLPSELPEFYKLLKNQTVAVRSSAMGEDAADASFAGQYDTLLNVDGLTALESAIESCLGSLSSQRAGAYRADQAKAEDSMAVVVQEMVDARAAGVLFTANPVSGRRDSMVIDAVLGLGEALVSGVKTPDHYEVSPTGELLGVKLVGNKAILSDEEISQLVKESLKAAKAAGMPLDLEWAIGHDGQIYWLQARPITTLGADPAELDWVPGHIEDTYTTYNVGEILPGAITPLTFSTVIRAMDVGMQRQHIAFGIQDQERPENTIAGMRLGHLFINLTKICEIGSNVAGASKEKICVSLCGRDIESVAPRTDASSIGQAINGFRFFHYVLQGKKYLAKMEKLVADREFNLKLGAKRLYAEISDCRSEYDDVFDCHMVVTSAAGLYEPIIMETLARSGDSHEEHHAKLASWLAGTKDVESADIAAGFERIMGHLIQLPKRSDFTRKSPENAVKFLLNGRSAELTNEFKSYLEKHGHRALRELELRQKEWAADPSTLVKSLQSTLKAYDKLKELPKPQEEDAAKVPLHLRFLVHKTKEAVRRRERSKSLLIAYTVKFKQAYRRLGALLGKSGLLADEDALFFLTHEEIGRLIQGEPALAQRALERRQAFQYQEGIKLPEVFVGKPEPKVYKATATSEQKLLEGTPANCGRIVGPARVVTKLEDAEKIEPGEILVTTVTDVGWTPYFSLISGLAADVGSSISHGAVVAREYGLPAVVNLGHATKVFDTGDMVVLDGTKGTIRLADKEDLS